MKKNIQIVLFFAILFVIQTKPVMAAKEMTCIYKGGMQNSATMLVQHSDGSFDAYVNYDTNTPEIDDNDWYNPREDDANVAVNFDDTQFYTSDGGLTKCPNWTRQTFSTINGSNYTFYFYDEKTWHLDYELFKTYDHANDTNDHQTKFNDDYTDEIANTKWVGICEYEDVDLYFNENKYILNNKNSLNTSTTATFSYNQLMEKYKKTGSCPSLYQTLNCSANIGNTFCKAYYDLYDGTTIFQGTYKEPINKSTIDDPSKIYEGNKYNPIIITHTCETLLGKITQNGSPAYYLHIVFNIVKYVAIILLIVLSAMDMVSAVASQDNDVLKKNVGKLIKRVVMCIAIFLLPTLVEFALQFITVGDNGNIVISTCGI